MSCDADVCFFLFYFVFVAGIFFFLVSLFFSEGFLSWMD